MESVKIRLAWRGAAMLSFVCAIMMGVGAQRATADVDARIPITISGYERPGTLTNFPVLVSLSTNILRFSYDLLTSPVDGADLRFLASNQTDTLNYEIESWNTNGVSHVWVQIPALASSNDTIYASLGNEDTSIPDYTTNGATWSAGFRGVWHMQDATNVTDSTENGNDGTGAIGIGNTNTAVAGNALALNGTSHYVDFGNGLGMGTNDVTLSIWLKTATATFASGFIGKTSYRSWAGRYAALRSTTLKAFAQFSGTVETPSTWGYSDGEWHLIASTYDRDGNMTVYVDGVNKSSASISAYSSYDMQSADPFYIGAYGNSLGTGPQPGFYFPGELDEGRLMNVAASSNWVWACWANQKPDADFLTYGPVENITLSVTALTPTGIGPTNATLRGRINRIGDGNNPEVYFCWGYTNAGTNRLGDWAHADYQGTNWGNGQSFSTNLTSLISGSNYVYRCYVTNLLGQAWSSEAVQFQTCYLPVVTNTGVSNIAISTVTLQGQVTDDGGGDGHPSVWFYYWTNGGSVTSTVAMGPQSVAFSQYVSGLTSPTDYTYQILASNAAGTVWSETNSFQTLPPRTNRWTGATDSAWFNTNNWDQLVVPVDGEAVIVTNTARSILLTDATALLSSFVITNATLTFTNWNSTLTASSVEIKSSATLALPAAFTNNTMSNRIWIACHDLTLHAGGSVIADNAGYAKQNGVGAGVSRGGGNGGAGGAGYGGSGGSASMAGGIAYGSASAPMSPGSGGGSSSGGGGSGGGSIWIDATGTIAIDGTVSSDGGNGGANTWGGGGGGSGGAIYIDCAAFGGTNGVLSANGGDGGASSEGYPGGGGAGGRIALTYANTVGTPNLRFTAAGGSGAHILDNSFPSDPSAAADGTLHFSDPALLDSTLTVQAGVGTGLNGYLSFESTNMWSPASLSVLSNCSLGVSADLALAVTNDLTVTTAGRLVLAGHADLSCSGDLTLTNGGYLVVYGGVTNADRASTYGTVVDVAGSMNIATSSWIYPYVESTNGGSVLFQVGSLAVQSGGGIDADGRGYARQNGPGSGTSGSAGGGGAYGGDGGNGNVAGGSSYGSANAPVGPGSGGGNGSMGAGGHAGGLVKIESNGRVSVDGTLCANGGDGLDGHWGSGGGGAGGAIHIVCASFSGNGGVLQADGGNCGVSGGGNPGGGGGGGRIAVWQRVPSPVIENYLVGIETNRVLCASTNEDFVGSTSVTPGTGKYNDPDAGSAQPGTVRFFTSGAQGTLFSFR